MTSSNIIGANHERAMVAVWPGVPRLRAASAQAEEGEGEMTADPAALAAALRALMEKATERPWIAAPYSDVLGVRVATEKLNIAMVGGGRGRAEANAALIIAAVNALPRLLAAAADAERYRKALELFERQWNACGPNSDFGRYFMNVRNAARAALAPAAAAP